MSRYDTLLELLDAREQQLKEVNDLHDMWNSDNQHDRAAADPGLQCAAGDKLAELDEEILEECAHLVKVYKLN